MYERVYAADRPVSGGLCTPGAIAAFGLFEWPSSCRADTDNAAAHIAHLMRHTCALRNRVIRLNVYLCACLGLCRTRKCARVDVSARPCAGRLSCEVYVSWLFVGACVCA